MMKGKTKGATEKKTSTSMSSKCKYSKLVMKSSTNIQRNMGKKILTRRRELQRKISTTSMIKRVNTPKDKWKMHRARLQISSEAERRGILKHNRSNSNSLNLADSKKNIINSPSRR